MTPKQDPATLIKEYKKQVRDLQAQVIILQAERDAAAALCAEQLRKIERLTRQAEKR